MNSIEKIGIGYLTTFIARSAFLDPFIDTNDKTPSWDGYIFVYKDENKEKKDLNGKIPIQIKCHKSIKRIVDTTSHLFEIDDLRNYLNDGGVILFVIEITDGNCQIFVKELWPSDLKEILDHAKYSQKTITISLKLLDNISTLDTISNNFILNREKQISTINYPLSIKNVKEIKSYFYPGNQSIEEYILSNEIPFYGKENHNDIERFITKGLADSLHVIVDKPVSINSIKFFPYHELIYTKDGLTHKFGKSVFIDAPKNIFRYKLVGTLQEQIRDLSFLINCITHKYIISGDDELLRFNSMDNEAGFLEQVSNHQKALYDIEILFKQFNIPSTEVTFDPGDKTTSYLLNLLLDAVIYNKQLRKIPFSTGFNIIKIGNKSLGVLIINNENDTTSLSNLNYRIKML